MGTVSGSHAGAPPVLIPTTHAAAIMGSWVRLTARPVDAGLGGQGGGQAGQPELAPATLHPAHLDAPPLGSDAHRAQHLDRGLLRREPGGQATPTEYGGSPVPGSAPGTGSSHGR